MKFARRIAIICFLFINFPFSYSEPKIIELVNDNTTGLFSNLTRVLEWIYCVNQNENFGLFINMNGAYGYSGNAFSALFLPFEDPKVVAEFHGKTIFQRTNAYPSSFQGLAIYPTDGMRSFQGSKYVYMSAGLYCDPDFGLFRQRLHPFAVRFFRPAADLQKKIDDLVVKMKGRGLSRDFLVGIHVRCLRHFPGCKKSEEEFLDAIESDVEKIMAEKDPRRTTIFLATLLEPLVKRLSAKYKVIVCDIPRLADVKQDWTRIRHADPLDPARSAIIDTWALAQCDELWCGSSNMAIFVGCLNPQLKITLLPSLNNYNGS
jgi:hypothetical protein